MKTLLSFLFLTFAILLTAGENVFIWSVTHPDHPGCLYFAGTVHLADKSFYPLDSAYDKVLEKSNILVFEIANPSVPQAVQFVLKNGMYPAGSGQSLEADFNNPELYGTFLKETEKCGVRVPSAVLGRMKPWLVFAALGEAGAAQLGYDPKYGLEKAFLAHAGKRRLVSLETDEQQLTIISDPGIKDEYLAQLKEFANDPPIIQKEIKKMFQAFRDCDESVMLAMVEENRKKTPVMYQKIIVDRNRNMAEKLYPMLAQKEHILVLVGLAHYIGPDSIISYLKKKGCIVKQHVKTSVAGKIAP